jgi:hypothetical protein
MKNYLDNRADNYVSQRFPEGSFNHYNPVENYAALLSRIELIGADIQRVVEFLSAEEEDVTDTIEEAVSTLEIKLQTIRDSVQYLSKLKLELDGQPSDIAVIDLSNGHFGNMSYSIEDHGLIMNSVRGSRYIDDGLGIKAAPVVYYEEYIFPFKYELTYA